MCMCFINGRTESREAKRVSHIIKYIKNVINVTRFRKSQRLTNAFLLVNADYVPDEETSFCTCTYFIKSV